MEAESFCKKANDHFHKEDWALFPGPIGFQLSYLDIHNTDCVVYVLYTK